ncbi:MAG: family 16 glycoside hydrolase [Gemmatales bacterium]
MQRLLWCVCVMLLVPAWSPAQDKTGEKAKNEKAKTESKKGESKKTPPAPEPADVTVTPKPRRDGWWQARHQTVLQKAEEQGPAVMFIGDSITQGWEGAGRKEWEKRFAPLNAVNLGFSGDRTQHVLWRLDEGREMAGYVPKAAMIMIGTNNSGNNSADQIADGIEAIVKLIRRKHPKTQILLLAVFPRGEKPDHPQRLKLIEVNKKIKTLDDGKWVKFLDIGDKFLAEDGVLPKEIMPDFLHLSEKGYGIWADAVESHLKEMVEKSSVVWQKPKKRDDGFVDIFNGKNLTGWYGWNIHAKGGSPAELEKLKPDARAKLIADWTADAEKHWSVQNGELVNDGHGAYLATEHNYRDYELVLEYKTVPLADSGIYLKATPQVQIWDSTEKAKFNIGADKGSGGLWNNSAGAKGKDPLVLADKKFGEWNAFRILQIGERTTVWLNGKLVVDDAVMENFWDRKKRLFAEGPIILQTHGGEIRWRNIAVRRISPSEAAKYLRSKSGTGFTSVFNGKDLEGWTGASDNYEVKDGAIVCKQGKGGVLYTKQEYANFHARLEFKLPPGGNNGLAIRYPGGSVDTAYHGMCELQVLDNDAEMYNKLDPRQYHGSAYGMAAAHRGYLRPLGEWNYQEVTVIGSKIKVELNGTIILETDLSKITDYMAKSPHPGKDRTSGYFGFAGHSDPVMFRNIEIKKLD